MRTSEGAAPQSSAATTAEFNAAQQHHRAGRLPQAEAIYRKILRQHPTHAEALHMLGMLAAQTGHHGAAIELLEQSVAVNPANGDCYNNLGNALDLHGELDRAIASFQQAIKLNPKKASYHLNLANAQLSKGAYETALEVFRKALSLQSQYPEAHFGLGNALAKMRRFDEAIRHYQKAIALKPDYIQAYNNMGTSLGMAGQADQAIDCFKKILLLEPDNATALNNLGNELQALSRLDEALAKYQRAVEVNPEFAGAHNNIGRILQQQENLEEAIVSYRRAIKHAPRHVAAYGNLATAMLALGRTNESLDTYREALDIELDPQLYSNYLLASQYSNTVSHAEVGAFHYAYSRHFETPVLNNRLPHGPPKVGSHPLRVGLVSGDLRQHPVGYFLENVLANLDQEKINITLYSCNWYEDALTARIKAMGFIWRDLVNLTDDSAARKILDDGIDILVDLSGHTALNRLPIFARKPAPVQVSWLGYWATTGLQAMDYILADTLSIPADEAGRFVETPYYLPDTRLCFTPPFDAPVVAELPALQNNYVTFGSFNNLSKINESVVLLWGRILNSVPNSRLYLKTSQFDNAAVRRTFLDSFARFGITQDRLILEGKSSREEYLRAYHRVDIALDPFPFTGATTSVEGLWMGVPFITRKGDSMLSRQGECLLNAVALPDWVARNDDDYLRCAVEKASDLAQLAALRQRLRAQLLASPICDAARFARNLEQAFRDMWQRHCQARASSHA